MVRPTLEYAATVWDPYQQTHIQSLESVQRRAARFVKGNFYERSPGCVTTMLRDLQWESLETRRLKSRLVMMFKIKHDLIDVPATSYLTSGDARTRGSSYRQPTASRDVYKYSFFLRTIRDWKQLARSERSQFHRWLQGAASLQHGCSPLPILDKQNS